VQSLAALESEIVACRTCERLVEWRERVGREKRKSFRDDAYWARPIPSFGDDPAPILIVGLAPAAHGANRTGRVFTGDRSADFLVAAMYRAGLASQPTSTAADDGLRLIGCRMTAAVRCAPPQNVPTPDERTACRPYLVRELALLRPRVIVALGGLAWQETLRALTPPRPWPRFGHGAESVVDDAVLVGCYHPSQQNTFTGRLTPTMIDDVLQRSRELVDHHQ
jgi:uracil-DNA glycosylase